MSIIFLQVLIILTVSSFEFQQVRLPWHRYWWVVPIHPNSIRWIIRFEGNAGLNTGCNKSQKQFPSLKMHFS